MSSARGTCPTAALKMRTSLQDYVVVRIDTALAERHNRGFMPYP